MSTEPSSSGSSSGLKSYFKGMLGLPTGNQKAASAPQAIAPLRITREDSAPELVGTPSDIGIYETSHEMGGRFTWKKLFQDPRTYSPTTTDAAPPPPPQQQ